MAEIAAPFFGIYADPEALPDAELLGTFIDESIDELIRCGRQGGRGPKASATTAESGDGAGIPGPAPSPSAPKLALA